MKKFLVLIAITTAAMTACAAPKTHEQKPVGMANPASEFCVSIGGKSIIKKDAKGGEYGVCQLPDGKEVEEWELYRSSAKIIIDGDTIKK